MTMITYLLGTLPVQEVIGRGNFSEAVMPQLVHRWAVSHWIQFALGTVAFLSNLKAFAK